MENKKDNVHVTEKSTQSIHTISDYYIDVRFLYLFKKYQKIASAIYLVTKHMHESEVLKNRLRTKVLDTFSSLVSLSSSYVQYRGTLSNDVQENLTHISALLSLSKSSGSLSGDNVDLLLSEIKKCATELSTMSLDTMLDSSIELAVSMFDVDRTLTQSSTHFDVQGIKKQDRRSGEHYSPSSLGAQGKEGKTGDEKDIKGQIEMSNKQDVRKSTVIDKKDILEARKESRKDVILSLLNKKDKLTIRDFASVIVDCSEKTIQRELIELVSSGSIIKEGERRWSTYSVPRQVQ